jgi:hypothetical protein
METTATEEIEQEEIDLAPTEKILKKFQMIRALISSRPYRKFKMFTGIYLCPLWNC